MNLKIIVNEKRKHKKLGMEGFPGGPVVKNPPPSARAMGSIPDLGRFHMPQGSRACALQPLTLCALEPLLCRKRSHLFSRRDRPHTAAKEWPLLAASRESPHTAAKHPCS